MGVLDASGDAGEAACCHVKKKENDFIARNSNVSTSNVPLIVRNREGGHLATVFRILDSLSHTLSLIKRFHDKRRKKRKLKMVL